MRLNVHAEIRYIVALCWEVQVKQSTFTRFNEWGNKNIKDLSLTLSYCEIFVFSMLLSQMTRFTIIISVAIV